MKYKLVANKEDINTLKSKYIITNRFFIKYINLNDYNDFSKIQELLDKQVIVNNETNTITVLA
jgi:hypothetical protein